MLSPRLRLLLSRFVSRSSLSQPVTRMHLCDRKDSRRNPRIGTRRREPYYESESELDTDDEETPIAPLKRLAHQNPRHCSHDRDKMASSEEAWTETNVCSSRRSLLRLLQMEFEDKRIPRRDWVIEIRQYLLGPALDFWLNLFDETIDLEE